MPAEVISYMMSKGDARWRLGAQLVLQCAPFLKGIKVSCIANMERDFLRMLHEMLMGTGISYRVLTVRNHRCLVFFYREEDFATYLERREVELYLRSCGYGDLKDVRKTLSKLSGKIRRCLEDHIGFPHEIGVFLNYPVRDVDAFIRNGGKNYLFSGYWKVYHEPLKARMIFCAYDEARKSAVNEFLTGKSIRHIAGKQG